MNILFIHNNFPGQFVHLAAELKKNAFNVAAISARKSKAVPDVKLLTYDLHDTDLSASHPFARRFEGECRRAEQVMYAASALKAEGFVPDVTVAHPGWGETLPIKEVFPATRLILYCEFFYGVANSDAFFDPEFGQGSIDASVRIHLKNAAMLLAMVQADKLYAPTQWQRSLFPEPFRSQIDVLHDGIDTDLAKPDPAALITLPSRQTIAAGAEIITFVARNLEPYRGYHIFMRALPEVLKRRPKAQVIIVGADGVSYGASPPKGETWKEVFLNEVRDDLDLSRVHFMGKLSYSDFLKVLQVSAAHVYLTYPFVLSWSMLEAMSAGCLLIGSDTPPVKEVIQDGKNGLLIPFFEPDALAERLIDVLSKPGKFRPLRVAAREQIVREYDLKTKRLPDLFDFITT